MHRQSIVIVSVLMVLGCAPSRPPGSAARPAASARIAAFLEIARAEARREHGVEALAARSTQGDPDVRMRALLGLGRVGSEDAVAVLVRALDDPQESIRRQAARALGIAQARTAEARLLDQYEREPATRAAIVEALGRLGSDAALTVLAEALSDPGLAEHAALALGRFGRRSLALDQGARQALVQAAATPDPLVRRAVAFALAREHAPPTGKEEGLAARTASILEILAGDADPEVRSLALRALSERNLGQARFPEALSDPDWRVRVAAVRGLVRPGGTADGRGLLAAFLMEEWAALAADAWQGPRIHVLTEALRGLGHAAADTAIRDLARTLHASAEDLLAHSPEPGARLAASTVHCLAAALLVRGGEPIALALGCGGAIDGGMPDSERKKLAAELAASGHGGTAAERMNVLRTLTMHGDSRVRAAAISALPALLAASADTDPARESILYLLARALEDPHAEVAGTAADALASMAKDADAGLAARLAPIIQGPLLERARAESTNIELIITLITALTATRAHAAAELCQRAHGHENITVRSTAQACSQALTGRDPGPGRAARPPALPPVDPADVLGKPLALVISTTRGRIEIALDTESAPWHVASLVHLARKGFYRDLLWHRVVPDFVVQGGDPTGSGWGGPDFVIPAEPGPGLFERGTVGIADAGLDTGGSQWFIMHSRAPHLDGRYTIIGKVVRGIDVVDALMVGDRILEVEIRAPR